MYSSREQGKVCNIPLKRIVTGIRTALWEKSIEFRSEWRKITFSSLISPLLYMLAPGWGLGSMINTMDYRYIDFLVPGILAITTMNVVYSSVAMTLNVQRLYERSFDQIIISPIAVEGYVIGQILGGGLRGLYSGGIILLVSLPFGCSIAVTPLLFAVMFLNSIIFSSLGVISAMLAKNHSDVARFSTFVITPMTFLCNTMFPIDRIPDAVRVVIKSFPLTHTASLLRQTALRRDIDTVSLLAASGYALVFIVITCCIARKKE